MLATWYNLTMTTKTKTKPAKQTKKRPYRQITPAVVAEFKALKAEEGNGSAAVRRQISSTVLAPGSRAFKIAKKSNSTTTVDFIDDQLQQIGVDAINRIGKLVNSTDERIATKNAHYAVDHLRGQATKKSVTLHGKLNIQNVLD